MLPIVTRWYIHDSRRPQARRLVAPGFFRRQLRHQGRLSDYRGALRHDDELRRGRQGCARQRGLSASAWSGRTCQDPKLVALAYAFEQVTRGRVPPPRLRYRRCDDGDAVARQVERRFAGWMGVDWHAAHRTRGPIRW